MHRVGRGQISHFRHQKSPKRGKAAPLKTDAPVKTVNISSADRLSLTLCFAIVIHGILILGIGFKASEPPKPLYKPLEIVLVQRTSKAPKEAELLAQAALEGGGQSDEAARASTPLPSLEPAPEPELAASPPPTPPASSAASTPTPAPEQPKPKNETPSEVKPLLTAPTNTPTKLRAAPASNPEPAPKIAEPEPVLAEESRPRPSAESLIQSSFALASLNAELQQRLDRRSRRLRRKYISANTREFKYAAYLEAWRAKVERIGNLNYPDEARRGKLSGQLILDVALTRDGSVQNVIVRRTSGFKVLDDAAIRIVRLASPYAPFPPNIRKETDILHITRTWQFLNNYRFTGR